MARVRRRSKRFSPTMKPGLSRLRRACQARDREPAPFPPGSPGKAGCVGYVIRSLSAAAAEGRKQTDSVPSPRAPSQRNEPSAYEPVLDALAARQSPQGVCHRAQKLAFGDPARAGRLVAPELRSSCCSRVWLASWNRGHAALFPAAPLPARILPAWPLGFAHGGQPAALLLGRWWEARTSPASSADVLQGLGPSLGGWTL